MSRPKQRGDLRAHLLRRAAEVPPGTWSPELQFNLRGLIVDLASELRKAVDEIRALRAVRGDR